jgi:hypothetical protein
MPIITLQKTMTPTMLTAGDALHRDSARVAVMMIINSIPYIFFRPSRSARYPKTIMPKTVPTFGATFMRFDASDGMFPLLCGSCQYTIPIIDITRPMAKS